ncbi:MULTISPECIES: hypothetical protein [Pseudomonas]|uniref:Uncharacterized protein n=2 Tax=Pseudomonas TaxID=286 RepID=A0A7X1GHR9_9PSED|nr:MULTISPECIES: hypothetical protein [Pseudomonas]MBC2692682.1 hypothetical protein [Pseudomonas kielensis]MDD1009393.1 hypothetical protein [Pseudomonas shahriarae]
MVKPQALRGFLRRDRDESGFFNGIPLLHGAVQSVSVGEGFIARFCLSEDVFCGGSVCEGRALSALLCRPGDAVPVAVLDATVLSRGTGRGMGISDSCDLLSESLNKIVSDLSSTSVDDLFCAVYNGGILFLNRLEVRSDCNHLGISHRFFNALTESVSQCVDLSLYALQPFPLQYGYCEPDTESPEYEAFWESYSSDVEKLSNFYCYEFGCKSASPGTGLLINAFPGWKLNIDRFGWSVVRSE